MYESFGAIVKDNNVEFRLFFPDNTLDKTQFERGRGGSPRIKEIRVAGDFQSEIGGKDWDFKNAPVMGKSIFHNPDKGNPIGWLYTFKIDQGLPDGFYQYKYFVTFENGQNRTCSDPCTKLSGEGDFENAAFVIGGNTTDVRPALRRQPFRDLIIYEMMVDNFTAEFRKDRAPLEAVIEKIPYLEELGINAIEFMPLTAVPGGGFDWGYRPFLFFSVENRYTKAAASPLDRIFKLKALINELHDRGIHVILDGVFNHVAKQDDPNKGFPYHWLYQNPEESPFTGPFGQVFTKLTDLDFNNNCTQQFISDVCKYWLDMFQFDGIRFDFTLGFLGSGNPTMGITKLITDLNNYLSSTGRGGIPLMLEHLNGFQAIDDTNRICATGNWFDEYLSKIRNYMNKNGEIDANPGENLRILNANMDYQIGKGPVIYIENHDHSTIVSEAGGRNKWFKTQPAAISLLTSPNAVLIHNGQEFGEDRCLTPFGQDETPGVICGPRVAPRPLRFKTHSTDSIGKTLFGLYKKLIRIRKEHSALRSSNFFPFPGNQDGFGTFADKDVIVYHRFGNDFNGQLERFVIVLNYSDFDHFIDIPFPTNGVWKELLEDGSINITNFFLRNEKINSNWAKIYFKKR